MAEQSLENRLQALDRYNRLASLSADRGEATDHVQDPEHEAASQATINRNTKKCPGCNVSIEKDSGWKVLDLQAQLSYADMITTFQCEEPCVDTKSSGAALSHFQDHLVGNAMTN